MTSATVLRICIGDAAPNLAREDGDNETGKTTVTVWSLCREETIAFICNFCCSLYNYNASGNTWPYWGKGFRAIDQHFSWVGGAPKSKLDCSVEENFTMGLSDYMAPLFVARSTGSTAGSQTFLFLWSILPFLYVCYFGCMFVLSVRSPGVKVQRALCLFGIFHFLFMTDVVAYKFGRGLWNPHSEIFHWFERWAWRIAILLPIYQNCTNGHWKNGHFIPAVGKLLHYSMAGWGVLFFLQQVITTDLFKFVQYLNGWEVRGLFTILGWKTFKLFSYHGGLVVMWIMYGLMLLGGFSHYRVFVDRDAGPVPLQAQAAKTTITPMVSIDDYDLEGVAFLEESVEE
jgi:hypothetical protein